MAIFRVCGPCIKTTN